MSNPAAGKMAQPSLQPGFKAEMIHVPNVLKAKVGASFGGIDPNAIAKAEAALKQLSSQFGGWLQDEVSKLEAARALIHTEGLNDATAGQLYTHAHDLKGLGATYEFPLIGRMAGSLCQLMHEPAKRSVAPLYLVDAHIDAIRAAIRDNIRDTDHPVGKILAEELERRVADYAKTEAGASVRA